MSPMQSDAVRIVHLLSDATVRACVILVAAAAAAVAMRRASSAARHAVWTLAVAATLAVPALTAVLPQRSPAVALVRPATAGPQRAARPTRGVATVDPVTDGDLTGYGDVAAVGEAARAAPPSMRSADAAGVSDAAYRWACLAWLSGVAATAIYWASGAVLVLRMDRAATPVVDGPLHRLLDDVRRQLSVRRRVRLLAADPQSMPATWGVLRPSIALPAGAVDWPPGRARAVLLHEMAHVRRWDCGVQHLTWLVTAAYWFNPLLWLAVRRLRVERERACDDVVVTAGGAATAYAESLVALARTFAARGPAAAAGLAMARRSGLRGRVRAVLSGDVNRRALGRRGRWAAVAAVVAAALAVSAVRPPARSTARAAGPASVPAAQPSSPPAVVSRPPPPAVAAQSPTAVSGWGITVDEDCECGTPVTAHVVSADHVSVTLDNAFQYDSWLFRLRGVAGRTLTIDVNMPARSATGSNGYSKTITPVYGTVADLDDPAGYTTEPLDVPSAVGRQGFPIPDTQGQAWHYIADAAWLKSGGFTMTQAFTTDTVYIANRVPRPPGYNDRFIDGLAGSPEAKVLDLGRTPEGRRLRAVQIGDDTGTGPHAKPCVLMAAGEQSYQPDGMWTCQGCVEFLLGDSDEAKAVRDQLVFLVVPTLDPDGTTHPDPRFMQTFGVDAMYPTSIAYANWIQGRAVSGRRLDLVLDLHSNQSGEGEHAKLWQLTGRSAAEVAVTLPVDDAIRRRFATEGLTVTPPYYSGNFGAPSRFGPWIDRHFGAIDMAYTMNAQAPSGHLTLSQMKETGRLLAVATAGVIGSRDGARLMALVDHVRADHDAAWRDRPTTLPAQNAIESEQAVFRAIYLKHVDRTNPNAATRPADFTYNPRQPPSQQRAADASLSMYTRTSARVELLAERVSQFAKDHDGRLPDSFGRLAEGLEGDDLHDLAEDCLTPGDEQRVGLPDHPTADWIDHNTSYVFPAAGLDLNRVKVRRGQRPAQVLGATAMFYTRPDQPFLWPYYDDEMVFVITLDGQRQVLRVNEAAGLIERSKVTLTAAGAGDP